jgi:hypothetical protein
MKLGLWGKYKCGHNIILAHAKTVQMYRQKYKPTQNGKLSIALDGKWGYAKDPKNPAGETQKPQHVVGYRGITGVYRTSGCSRSWCSASAADCGGFFSSEPHKHSPYA